MFVLGLLAGALATYFGLRLIPQHIPVPIAIAPQPPPVCYSCFWEGYNPKFRVALIDFYRQFKNPDPMVSADVRYILWRATSIPNCEVQELYRAVADGDQDVYRQLMARAILGFGGPECGQDGSHDLKKAAELAQQAGLTAQSKMLRRLSGQELEPHFGDVEVATSLSVPPNPKTMILGRSTIEIPQGLRVGTQVARVARDWISYQMKWDLTGDPLPATSILDYHEGRLAKSLISMAAAEVYPLGGTLVAKKGEKWFASDETGVFRFEISVDKLQYPTTHAAGSFGWIVDTHGISALVNQVLQRHLPLVLGSGDSESEAKAAFYLAQRGVNVVFPGDRYQDLLLGYQAKGILLGTAPVKQSGSKVLLGGQPVYFSLREPIVVEDTKPPFPIGYYDAPARYFRRLSEFAPLNLHYVSVEAPDEIWKVLERAMQLKATAVAVRVAAEGEYETLRGWLVESRQHRAILFHSGLYPYAQPLFEEFPRQVTFGDLRPRFE